ncbi:MAG: hypothetical protein RL095_2830 [Verrucomicrobiota bacterium]|jgi:hypothetical protein
MKKHFATTAVILVLSCASQVPATVPEEVFLLTQKPTYSWNWQSHGKPDSWVELFDASSAVTEAMRSRRGAVDQFDKTGKALMFYAISSYNPKLICALLELGAKREGVTDQGLSALEVLDVERPYTDPYGNPACDEMRHICFIILSSPQYPLPRTEQAKIEAIIQNSRYQEILRKFWY